jgi:hypothetical protein
MYRLLAAIVIHKNLISLREKCYLSLPYKLHDFVSEPTNTMQDKAAQVWLPSSNH